MTVPNARVLLVEDDPSMSELLASRIRRRGHAMSVADSAQRGLQLFEAEPFDLVISDIRLGGMTGLELCEQLVARRSDVPVILVTAFSDLDTAIAAIRAGAHDFFPKPFEIDELLMRLDRALELRFLRAEVGRLREGVLTPLRFENMIGDSAAMRRLFAMVERVSASDAPVLITGETGTGKELVARAVHAGSRPKGPFVAINCAAMPEQLLESELFGHTKGAFTDARAARAGLFVEADGGTLFLDEIGEMPIGLQAKLLRAVQERKVRPLGSDKEVTFNARLISATHRDLESRVAEGKFREDLFYRLAVLPLSLPPLRERGSDVLVLATEYLSKISERAARPKLGLSPEAARKLIDYSWPGNVRELVNAMERAAALALGDTIQVADLPEKIQAFASSHVLVTGGDASELVSLEEVERRYILRVIETVGGNRTRAAEILRVDRKTLYSKLKAYGWRGPE